MLNADLLPPVDNNHSPYFFAWHGCNDDVWVKREPRLNTFQPLQSDSSDFPQPGTLAIVRDLLASSDAIHLDHSSVAPAQLHHPEGHDSHDDKAEHGDDPLRHNCCNKIRVIPARPSGGAHGDHDLEQLTHLEESWLTQSLGLLNKFSQRLRDRIETVRRCPLRHRPLESDEPGRTGLLLG